MLYKRLSVSKQTIVTKRCFEDGDSTLSTETRIDSIVPKHDVNGSRPLILEEPDL